MFWTYVVDHLNGEGNVGTFSEKELQNKNWKELRIDKVYIRWKGYINSFNSWIDKKTSKCWLELSNFAARIDLKNATGADTSDLNTDLCWDQTYWR